MPTATMLFDVIARTGQAEGSFRRVAGEADAAGRSFDRLGKAAFGMTALFAAFAVNEAARFESAMTRISTQAGVPIGQLKALGDSLLQLAPKVGTGPEALATSLYHVESAFRTTGITAKAATDIVANAAKLAKIGNANLEDTTQAIIGVLASKIKGVKDATDAAAQLNQLVGTGDTTLPKVDKAIASGILPTAATLGLTFKDVAAGIATLTDNVTPADEAATRFKTTLLTLIKPSHQQVVAFQEIGLGALQLGQDFRKPNGLLVAVQDLKTHLDETFPAGQKTALTVGQLDKVQQSYYQNLVNGGTNAKDAAKQALSYRDSLVGVSAETLRANAAARALGGSKTAGVFLTFGQEIDRLKSKYQDYGTSAQAAAKFQEAWNNQQATFKQKLDDLKASWDVFLIRAGNAILPTLKKITDFLSAHPALLKDAAYGVLAFAGAWATLKVANLISSLGTLATKILTVGTASRTAAGEVAALDLASAGGKGVGGAAAGVAGLSSALAGLAPLAVGIGALALDIHQIVTDGQVKHLPALDAVAAAINQGGLTGKPGTDIIQASLAGVSSGDNRKESQLDYLKRVLASPQAKLADAVTPLDLTLKGLFKTIQTGSQSDLTGFITALREVGFQLKGSPNTIANISNYLQGLFSRYNSGRLVIKQNAAEVQAYLLALNQAKGSILGTSTDVGFLSKQLGISRDAAAKVAEQNNVYDFSLKTVGARISTYNQTLAGNTVAAKNNRDAITSAAQEVRDHAAAVLKQTGNVQVSDAVFKTGIATIEQNAAAVGVNKGEVDKLINSLHLIPPISTADIKLTGVDTAEQQVANFLAALARIPAQQSVDLQVITTGTASAATIAQATAGGRGGHQADGGIYPHGVPGGVVQWAEAGGESFIPHDPSKRARALDIWLKTGRVLGVQGMASGAFRPTAKDWKAIEALATLQSGGQNPAVASYLKAMSEVANYLKALAQAVPKLTSKLTSFVQAQQQYRDSLQGQLTQGNTFTDILGQSGNPGDVKSLLKSKLSSLRTFISKIVKLKTGGWPDGLIRDIASQGVDVGNQSADLLLSASKADKASIIGLENTLAGNQLHGANLTTLLTGGTQGLGLPALKQLNSAIFSPGANITALIAAIAKANAARPLIGHVTANSTVDLEAIAKQALFLQQAGAF